MAPKLSIITINYNNAPGLKKTMESVFSQTSKEFEYIVIDGGSTDDSVSVIKEFEEKKQGITRFIWISEKDEGIYHAMNKGIDLANGEYCQFLNSGDWLVAPDVTANMLAGMPNCAIVYGNKIKVLTNGMLLREKQVPEISMLTFYKGTLNHCTAYIKKSLFDTYGKYDEELQIVSDWKFYLIAIGINNETVVYKNVDVCYYDMSGVSNTNTSLNRLERRKVLEELLPENVLSDYDKYWFTIEQSNRITNYPFIKKVIWLIERSLFKMEGLKRKIGMRKKVAMTFMEIIEKNKKR